MVLPPPHPAVTHAFAVFVSDTILGAAVTAQRTEVTKVPAPMELTFYRARGTTGQQNGQDRSCSVSNVCVCVCGMAWL